MPLNISSVISRMWKKVQEYEAAPPNEEFLILAYDPSPWKSEIYMTVNKEIPGEKNVRLSGAFISKVFDGPYNEVPKWIKTMEEFIASKGKVIKKNFFYEPYCPKCAKFYQHHYVIDFAEVA